MCEMLAVTQPIRCGYNRMRFQDHLCRCLLWLLLTEIVFYLTIVGIKSYLDQCRACFAVVESNAQNLW